MSQGHKVFISYHHANDEAFRARFEFLFGTVAEAFVSRSVQVGDIDPGIATETIRRRIRDEFLRDSSVTVVLIGSQTWQRKHVDWEIYSSLRDTQFNPRSGLVGILLPTCPRPGPGKFDPFVVPPRLYDNFNVKFANVYEWSEDSARVQGWIHQAFLRRTLLPPPDLSRPLYGQNRTGARWSPP